MKQILLILMATVALTMTAINCQAQDSGTYQHSSANGEGGLDTITVVKPLPPPPQPKVAMFDKAIDDVNPFIAINDPAKDGHSKPKPEYNHDGRAFEGYVRPENGQ
jgi:hypothetical protein